MRLEPGRLTGMIEEAVHDDTAIICHSTLYGQSDQEAVCHGFFTRHSTIPLRLAQAMGVIEWTDQ